MDALMILLRSEYWGAGKTHTALSYSRPGVVPRRLLYDAEFRDGNFKSPDDKDHPELAQFTFDVWHTRYGDDTTKAMLTLARELWTDAFHYNVVVFDNASMLQDELDAALSDKNTAVEFARAFDIDGKFGKYLQYRFNPNDTASYYYFVKAILRSMLVQMRKLGVDVLVTSETKNVWANYGSRDRNNPPRIKGQTFKLWDPWMQMGDVALVLERISGSRDDGTAKLTPWPTATLDTFNPKCSIPGIVPVFEFQNWDVFWKMVERRKLPTAADFAKVDVPASEYSADAGLSTIAEAKQAIVEHAQAVKFIKDLSVAEKTRLAEWGKQRGLNANNALAEYFEWIAALDEAVADDSAG